MSASFDKANIKTGLENEHLEMEAKMIKLENIDVCNLTAQVMKRCNVIRDKNYGSKLLFKKTGIVCGARSGANMVHEPILKRDRAQSCNGTRNKQFTLSKFAAGSE